MTTQLFPYRPAPCAMSSFLSGTPSEKNKFGDRRDPSKKWRPLIQNIHAIGCIAAIFCCNKVGAFFGGSASKGPFFGQLTVWAQNKLYVDASL